MLLEKVFVQSAASYAQLYRPGKQQPNPKKNQFGAGFALCLFYRSLGIPKLIYSSELTRSTLD